MFGYIYKTTNTINGKIYIGKHQASNYDSSYYGSGKLLCKAIKKYGIENFSNEVIDIAITEEELNLKEIAYITEYKEKYGDNCYNIAAGGNGGNTLLNASQEYKEAFKKKMTEINRERCASDDFKQKLSIATSERYKNSLERERQRIKQRTFWDNNEDARKRQSELLKKIHAEYRGRWNNGKSIPCVFQLGDIVKEFKTLNELSFYLEETYNWKPGNKIIKRIFDDSIKGIPYKPFRKNKNKAVEGLFLFRKDDFQKQGVTTRTDECKSVE